MPPEPPDDMPRGLTPIYAPLFEKHVACAILNVYEVTAENLQPAFDAQGEAITLLPNEGLVHLARRIAHPGRYRIAARDPRTNRYIAWCEHALRPAPKPVERPADHDMIAELRDQVRHLREQLRDDKTRYDEALRHERQSAVDARQFAAERVDEARRKAHEAEVLVAGYTARLEARDLRIAELEAQITDMKAEVHNARRLAEELKHKADDAEFSPLDAILQMDQALDVIGKTADRFGK